MAIRGYDLFTKEGAMKIFGGVVLAVFALPAFAVSWAYDAGVDKMTGKESKTAWVRSENSLKLDFPYAGENFGVLSVRRHPKYGTDVAVKIDKGQLMCRSYDPCSVMVRFDESKPVRFSGYPSADHDSTVVFIEPEARFIAMATKAKRILVQLTLYRGGDQVLEFSTPNTLNWVAPKK
jgi:hypothetical protein